MLWKRNVKKTERTFEFGEERWSCDRHRHVGGAGVVGRSGGRLETRDRAADGTWGRTQHTRI